MARLQEELATAREARLEAAASLEGLEALLATNLCKQRQVNAWGRVGRRVGVR